MPIDDIPDWERRIARQDAFWQCAILDRPVVNITIQKQPRPVTPPVSAHATLRDRWMDAEFIVSAALTTVQNRLYLGDALPTFCPNLGPEVFSAFFGTELEYGESTSWSVPNLQRWSDAASLEFRPDNFYWRKLNEITDALLQGGRGRFYTGLTDFHPGGDALAAFRGPENLAVDMIEDREAVLELMSRVDETYLRVFQESYDKLAAAGQAITSWPGIVSSRKWYVPSNDFSIMISKPMFDEFFLPGIARECRFYEASIYHLDGPGALRHLDSLLTIPELNAIQWIFGAGNEPASRWMDVYRKCQAAGKGLQITLHHTELDVFMETLRPEGLWLSIKGVKTVEEAEFLLRRVAQWK